MIKTEVLPLANKDQLDLKAMVILLVLTSIWGFTYPLVKFTNQGISPVFASTLRSTIASICGIIYCLSRGERLFHTDIMFFMEPSQACCLVWNSRASTSECSIPVLPGPSYLST